MLTEYSSNWKWPEVPGLNTFQGELVHTANWPRDFDFANKTVAVVGNGSSGIQVLPAIHPGSSYKFSLPGQGVFTDPVSSC